MGVYSQCGLCGRAWIIDMGCERQISQLDAQSSVASNYRDRIPLSSNTHSATLIVVFSSSRPAVSPTSSFPLHRQDVPLREAVELSDDGVPPPTV